LKENKLEILAKVVNYIEENGKKWLGPNHPIFVRLNRIIAEYYCNHRSNYMKAIALAKNSLEMQSILFGGDSEALWKDYFLFAKIYFVHENY
jgi:hypothetical protein